MTFNEVLAQVLQQLQREGRVSYRALKRQFALDDDYLEDLKTEIIDAKRLATDEDGKVLVWTGASPVSGFKFQVSGSQPPIPNPQPPASYTPKHLAERILTNGASLYLRKINDLAIGAISRYSKNPRKLCKKRFSLSPPVSVNP